MNQLPAETAELLTQPKQAILAVNRAGSGPHLSVVWFHWDGEAFLISTLRDRAKARHIRRDPAVTLLVNDDENDTYITASGRADLRETGHAELTRRLFAKYLPGTDPTAAVRDPNRIVIRVQPERIVAHRA